MGGFQGSVGHLRAGAHPTLTLLAQCVPFLGKFLTVLKILDTRMEDYLDVVTWGLSWGDQDWLLETESPCVAP